MCVCLHVHYMCVQRNDVFMCVFLFVLSVFVYNCVLSVSVEEGACVIQLWHECTNLWQFDFVTIAGLCV